MSIKRALGTAVAACLSLCAPVGAQGPAPQKQPLACPIIVAPPDNPQAPALDCVVPFGPAVPMSALAFSPDGKTLAAGGYQEVLLWDLAGAKLAKRIATGGRVGAGAVLREGPSLARGAYKPAHVWNVDQKKLGTTIQGHGDWVLHDSSCPDRNCLTTTGADNTA